MTRLDSLKAIMPKLSMSKIQKGKFRLWAAVTKILWGTNPNQVSQVIQGGQWVEEHWVVYHRRSLWIFRPKLKSQKKYCTFFLETSLVYLGTSPDIIGKISWPLKEAIPEPQTFPLNLTKYESKLLGSLEGSFLGQYASAIPFWNPLDTQIWDS